MNDVFLFLGRTNISFNQLLDDYIEDRKSEEKIEEVEPAERKKRKRATKAGDSKSSHKRRSGNESENVSESESDYDYNRPKEFVEKNNYKNLIDDTELQLCSDSDQSDNVFDILEKKKRGGSGKKKSDKDASKGNHGAHMRRLTPDQLAELRELVEDAPETKGPRVPLSLDAHFLKIHDHLQTLNSITSRAEFMRDVMAFLEPKLPWAESTLRRRVKQLAAARKSDKYHVAVERAKFQLKDAIEQDYKTFSYYKTALRAANSSQHNQVKLPVKPQNVREVKSDDDFADEVVLAYRVQWQLFLPMILDVVNVEQEFSGDSLDTDQVYHSHFSPKTHI